LRVGARASAAATSHVASMTGPLAITKSRPGDRPTWNDREVSLACASHDRDGERQQTYERDPRAQDAKKAHFHGRLFGSLGNHREARARVDWRARTPQMLSLHANRSQSPPS